MSAALCQKSFAGKALVQAPIARASRSVRVCVRAEAKDQVRRVVRVLVDAVCARGEAMGPRGGDRAEDSSEGEIRRTNGPVAPVRARSRPCRAPGASWRRDGVYAWFRGPGWRVGGPIEGGEGLIASDTLALSPSSSSPSRRSAHCPLAPRFRSSRRSTGTRSSACWRRR